MTSYFSSQLEEFYNFSGYVFSPDGTEPTNVDVQADIIKMQKMNNNWYYVSCT